MLKAMLRVHSSNVHRRQLESFLAFVQKTCPWFPEEATINEQTWQKVGLQLKQCFTLHGPWDFPRETSALWNLVKGSLDPSPEATRLPDRLQEGGSMERQLKQAVTSYEALANTTASGDNESLPPKYEEQQREEPPGNGQRGAQCGA